MSLLLALALVPAIQQSAVAAVLKSLPNEVAGLSRHWDEQSASDDRLIAYMGPAALDPMIVLAVAPIGPPGDFESARKLALGQPNSLGVLKTMFEGRFAVPLKPDANTFFGEYVTEKGLMQVWLIEHGGIRTLVSATILRTEDRRRMFDAVRSQLLGGATIIKDEQPAAVKH